MGSRSIHTHMAMTTMKTTLFLFAALCLTFGFCQEKDIVSEDDFQTSSETTRTSELDQAGWGWRRRRGDQARRERQGKQNLRNAERGNKERKSKGSEAKTKKAAAERKSKNASALKKEDTQKAQGKKNERKAKALRKAKEITDKKKLENQHKNAHQQFSAAAAKKAEKAAKKARWLKSYQKRMAQAAAKLKRTFSGKIAKAREKGSKKNPPVNVDKVGRECAKGREILGSTLLQWGFIKTTIDNIKTALPKYVEKGKATIGGGEGTSQVERHSLKMAKKRMSNQAKDLLDCVNKQIGV